MRGRHFCWMHSLIFEYVSMRLIIYVTFERHVALGEIHVTIYQDNFLVRNFRVNMSFSLGFITLKRKILNRIKPTRITSVMTVDSMALRHCVTLLTCSIRPVDAYVVLFI